MKLPYEWQIGLRYTRVGKRTTGNGLISFVVLTSATGIALGVSALIVVLSVMNGFKVEVSDVAKDMKSGYLTDLVPGELGIVLGSALATNLQVQIGDRLTFFAPGGSAKMNRLLPEFKQFKVVGTFESGHYQYDSALAYIDIHDAQALFHRTAPSGVRLRLHDMQGAPEVALELAQSLSGNLYIHDWTQQNKTWFVAQQLQKRMLFMILMLIISVAAFNLVSSLVMTVTHKQADIAILRTLGAQPGSIMKIFMIQGMTVGLVGTTTGIFSGCSIALSIPKFLPAVEHVLGIQFLTPSIYFLSELPSKLLATDVIEIGAIGFLMSSLATLYPSWRSSKVRPAEALRYE